MKHFRSSWNFMSKQCICTIDEAVILKSVSLSKQMKHNSRNKLNLIFSNLLFIYFLIQMLLLIWCHITK